MNSKQIIILVNNQVVDDQVPVHHHHLALVTALELPQHPVVGPGLGLHPGDDDAALLGPHHELAGDGWLEAETVDAGRELLILAVTRLHLVLAHRLLDVPAKYLLC